MAQKKTKFGTVAWRDLTVSDAEKVRDFYQAVVGWRFKKEDMGGYSDFSMLTPGSEEVAAGICHARGVNADLPSQWLIYILVPDLAASLEQCFAMGGCIVSGPREMGKSRFCVIRDPAGAVCALYQP